MASVSPTPGSPPDAGTEDREGGLTWLLIVAMLAWTALGLYSIVEGEAMRAAAPGLSPALSRALVACSGLGIVSAIGALARRRWGVVGLVAAFACVSVVAVLAGAPLEHTLMGPAGIVLLVIQVRGVWSGMR